MCKVLRFVVFIPESCEHIMTEMMMKMCSLVQVLKYLGGLCIIENFCKKNEEIFPCSFFIFFCLHEWITIFVNNIFCIKKKKTFLVSIYVNPDLLILQKIQLFKKSNKSVKLVKQKKENRIYVNSVVIMKKKTKPTVIIN